MTTFQFDAGVRRATFTFIAALSAAAPFNALSQTLETVTIEGEAIQTDSVNKPFTLLRNDELSKTPGSTVAEKMERIPGVSSTGFAPGASRPIIRGQDSDRVKIMRNSSASVDASSVSPDHALPVDSLMLNQIEVTRGAASLAYGGNAIGGAVNLVDDRIARESASAFTGEFNTELFGPANTQATGIKLATPTFQGLNLRVDAFDRDQDDLRTPEFTDPNGTRTSRIANSSLNSSGGGIGLSYTHNNGYTGFSAESFDSNYGVAQTEPDESIRIGMDQVRYSLEGEYKFANTEHKLRYRLSQTDYGHQEFEDGQAATRFTNDGVTGRLEWFNQLGQFGIQSEQTDFSAIGDEAFVPANETDLMGLYYIGQKAVGGITFDYGLRVDQTEISSLTSGANPTSGPIVAGLGFTGPALNRDFNAFSASIGANWLVTQNWTFGATLGQSERAPSSFELLADGVHVATAAYEKGDPNLSTEESIHMELSSKWKHNTNEVNLGIFQTDFDNYIGLFRRTGANSTTIVDGEAVQIYQFVQVPAVVSGLELQAKSQYRLANWLTEPSVQLDLLRGKRSDTGESLPRQTPLRLTVASSFQKAGWSIAPQVQYVGDSKPAPDETRTASYTLVNLRVNKDFVFDQYAGQVFLSLDNLTDELAFSANTIETVRGFNPLAGRSATLGLKVLF